MEKAMPLAYLLTIVCYGTHAKAPAVNALTRYKTYPIEPAYLLDEIRRLVALRAVEETCDFHGWALYAAHIRTHMIHLVLRSPEPGERLIHLFQTHLNQRLKESKLDGKRLHRWASSARVKALWKAEHVRKAVKFVVEEQGMPMAVCENPIPTYQPGETHAS